MPERLLALTRKVCLPKASFFVVKGDRQGLNGLRSSLHWKSAPSLRR